jgi:hypothetical protein
LKLGGAFSTEDDIPDGDVEEYIEPEIAEYDSLEEFLANEDMVVAGDLSITTVKSLCA